MSAILMDGKKLRDKIYFNLNDKIEQLAKIGKKPHITFVLIGEDAASKVYIGSKQKACEKFGITSSVLNFQSDITFDALKKEMKKLNEDDDVDGILVQFPVPKHLSKRKISILIDRKKDVDGVSAFNQGVHFTRQELFATAPCTPQGIMELLKEYKVPLEGQHAVIIGRSNIVGRPMVYMLANANASVTLLHKALPKEQSTAILKTADIIISATGVADLVTPDMVKEGVVLIDVGIIKIKDDSKEKGYYLRGDLSTQNFMEKASFITPVPGGVGPLTITMLIKNIIDIAMNKYL